MQQFANRLYAPVFITGLNYWAQGFGNYWGHNAIIRTEPFMQCCDLPQLPGRKPFGGQILSHDFVEAALLLKENWQRLVRVRSGRQLRGSAAGIDRKRAARSPLVPGQFAARHGALCARIARHQPACICCWASSAIWPARCGCAS